MIGQGKTVTFALIDNLAALPVTEPAGVAPRAPRSIYVFPKEYYPIPRSVNQICLYWFIGTMPTGATYVDVTPFAARGINQNQQGRLWQPSFATAGAITKEFYKFQFDQLDTTNSRVNVFPYKIHKTAADGTTTDSGGYTYNTGTRHALQIADPYIGFLVETDGTDATGTQFFSVTMTWA